MVTSVWEVGVAADGKGQGEVFWGDRSCYLDRNLGYKGVWFCQNSSKCTVKIFLLYAKFSSKEKSANTYWIVAKDMHTKVFRKKCSDVGNVF